MSNQLSARFAAAALSGLALAAVPIAAQAAERLGGVVGCEAPGGKQEGGAVLGAVIGGIAGSNLAKNDRGTGTVVGAVAGAAAGSYVGCNMQKNEAAKAADTRTHSRIYPVAADDPGRPVVVEEEVRYRDRDRDHDHDRDDDDRFVPPGHRHGHGMPPGLAKKYYDRGERLPVVYVREPRYVVVEPRRYGLRHAPMGYRWVLVDHDAYLVRTETGLIAEVVRAVLG